MRCEDCGISWCAGHAVPAGATIHFAAPLQPEWDTSEMGVALCEYAAGAFADGDDDLYVVEPDGANAKFADCEECLEWMHA